ncbi:hypothetical protein [Chryseobacterium mulctrae]|uniref:hypothetical protein n=1 Tax=Chryseobacterium mulctrae TaxID=2576777 RepID=UPI001115D3DF|nr:hypothetical protein [Chryseobacterium mulctrae]
MKKLYSKRRLKKMGIYYRETKNEIFINLSGQSIGVGISSRLTKQFKDSNKTLNVTFDFVGSCASWIAYF